MCVIVACHYGVSGMCIYGSVLLHSVYSCARMHLSRCVRVLS
jgi:hypothetical protein